MTSALSATEVRGHFEMLFEGHASNLGISLFGTSVTGSVVTALVGRPGHGLHAVHSDVEVLSSMTEATTLDRLLDEMLFRAIHYQDLTRQQTNEFGITEWR